MARASAACQRCRRRKQKCDLSLPNCSNCERANISCLTYDPGKQAEIPRNYVSHLEAQIQRLNQEVRELRRRPQPELNVHQNLASTLTGPSAVTDEATTFSHAHDLVDSVRNIVVEPSKSDPFLGPSSGVTLARMVMGSINVEALPPRTSTYDIQRYSSALTPSLAEASSLPPRHAADHLVEVYFQYRTPHLPIIQEAQVRRAVESAFISASGDHDVAEEESSESDLFISYMVFAIALCNVPSPTGGTGRPLQSGGCFRSAVQWIEKIIAFSKSDPEKLRAILLLAQFVSMCPWQGSLWHLTGIALRLCVDRGLHWETDEQALHQPQDLLYDRRRLWYSAYHFDRVLGITLGRPFGIPDEGTRVALPNPWAVSNQSLSSGQDKSRNYDTHHQRAHNHIFTLAQLQSEMKHVHQSQTWAAKIAYPRPNYTAWLQDIRPRLQEWYSTIPDPALAHPMSIFAHRAYWDALYNNAILLLHRPHSTSPSYSPADLVTLFEASDALIASIKLLQRDGRLDVLWKAVHDLFIAGLTVIFCVWQSSSLRSAQPISKIIAVLQSCISTLSAMSENFAGAVGCRNAFETLSTATIDWLLTSVSDPEESVRSKTRFEKQVGDLLGDMQPRVGESGRANWEGYDDSAGMMNDISMMLSSSNAVFGEMLSLAAQ